MCHIKQNCTSAMRRYFPHLDFLYVRPPGACEHSYFITIYFIFYFLNNRISSFSTRQLGWTFRYLNFYLSFLHVHISLSSSCSLVKSRISLIFCTAMHFPFHPTAPCELTTYFTHFYYLHLLIYFLFTGSSFAFTYFTTSFFCMYSIPISLLFLNPAALIKSRILLPLSSRPFSLTFFFPSIHRRIIIILLT